MEFFSETHGKIVYERYDILHFEMIISFLLVIILMFIFKDKLKKFKYKDKPIRYIFATILFVNLTGSYKESADVDKNGKVSAVDYAKIKNYIMGYGEIKQ